MRFLVTLVLGLALATSATAQAAPGPDQFAREGRFKEAAQAIYTMLEKQTGPTALQSLEKLVSWDPDMAILIDRLTQLGTTHPDTAVRAGAVRHGATLHLALGRTTEARALLLAQVAVQTNDWAAQALLIRTDLLLFDLERVRERLDLVLRLAPPDPWLNEFTLLGAHYFLQAQRTTEAESLLESLHRSPSGISATSLYLLSLVQDLQGKSTGAESSRKELARRFPGDPLALAIQNESFVYLDPLFSLWTPGSWVQGPSTASTPRGGLAQIQLGAFQKREYADSLRQVLEQKIPEMVTETVQEQQVWKVYGQIPAGQAPQEFLRRLKDLGFEGFEIQR